LDKDHEEAKAKLKEVKETRLAIQQELQEDQVEGAWVPTPLRNKLEQGGLKPFLIEKAAYWGKLVGNGCRRLFGNATAIFDIINVILVEEATISKMDPVGVENVQERCRVTRDAMILFDGFFSSLTEMETSKELSDYEVSEKIKSAAGYVSSAMKLWRALSMSVTPKAHVCERHACKRINTSEEWVERLHQEHLRDNIRTRSMRDKARKFAHISRWEQANRNSKIDKLIQEIHHNRALKEETKVKRAAAAKRKRAESEGDAVNRMRTHEERQQIRKHTLDNFVEPTRKLPTALEENIRENRLG
jgi:hypothetical protein